MQDGANKRNTVFVSQVGRAADHFIFLYNILADYDFPPVQQPPTFPNFKIPKCPKGEKFAYTVLPAQVNNPIERNGAEEGTTEITYFVADGREAANSLCNPDAHPKNPFEAQFRDISKMGNGDQLGNNLNEKGIFWSLTSPYIDEAGNQRPLPGDDPKVLNELIQEGKLFYNEKLDEEIAAMRKRVDKVMRTLVDAGNTLNAANKRAEIAPDHHFAMEYFNLEAEWHRSHEHRIACPNCGDPIREKIAYHKNQFNMLCVVDWQAAYEAGVVKKEDVPESKRWWQEEEEPVGVGAASVAPKTKRERKQKV